jgi:signal transduction histidine kinase
VSALANFVQGRWGLRAKFILWVNLLVVLLVAAATLLFENRQRNAIIREVEKRALVVAQRLADASTTYLLTYNYVALEQLVRQMPKDPDILYTILLDKEGNVAAHSLQYDLLGRILRDRVSARAVLAREPTVQRYLFPGAAQTPVFDASVPVVVEQSDEKWGTVRVGVSLASMQAEIGRTRAQVALFALLAVAMGSLASVILARRIVRPLQALARGVAAVGQGDLTQRLTVDTGDELGDLATTFNEMTAKLAHLRELEDRLRQADRLAALGTMAAGIAHDIRNPLTSISIFTQLMSAHYDDPGVREKFDRVVPRELERVQGVIDDMLELARPASHSLERINPNDLLLQALDTFEVQMAAQRIIAKPELHQALPLTLADRRRMHRCFQNIILNAIQAMPDGGELMLSTGPAPRDGRPSGADPAQAEAADVPSPRAAHQVAPPQEIVIRIGDTGHGIPENQLPHVFDPFFTTREKGTGLGMAITHKILEDHRARIAVASRVGHGTTITIHLPVCDT